MGTYKPFLPSFQMLPRLVKALIPSHWWKKTYQWRESLRKCQNQRS